MGAMCRELVPGVLVNGAPLTLPRRCSICTRHRTARPGWQLYEDQVLCVLEDQAREGQGRRAKRPLTLPVIHIETIEFVPGDEGTRDLVADGRTLGRVEVRHDAWTEITKSGRRYFARCSCGYASTTKVLERLALAAAVHHLSKVITEAKRNAQPKPPCSIEDAPARAYSGFDLQHRQAPSTKTSHPVSTLIAPAHVEDQLPGGAATG